MFKIIGFIPQTSQGLFSYEDKHFTISPPFKNFTVNPIPKSEIDESVPFVQEYAYYEELENVFQHFENMHLLEMLNNKNLISTLSKKLQETSLIVDEILKTKTHLSSENIDLIGQYLDLAYRPRSQKGNPLKENSMNPLKSKKLLKEGRKSKN